MSCDPGSFVWRVLWRSLVLAAVALFVAWHVAPLPVTAPPTPPNDRAVVLPVPKPGVP